MHIVAVTRTVALLMFKNPSIHRQCAVLLRYIQKWVAAFSSHLLENRLQVYPLAEALAVPQADVELHPAAIVPADPKVLRTCNSDEGLAS
jgi:hypothetical protein